MNLKENGMRTEIAIITVREDEYEAVHQRFKPTPYRGPGGRTYGICRIETKSHNHNTIAIARCSEQGNDTSQRLAHDIIQDLDPQIILVVGIAGGVPHDEFTLGDVIVSSRIHNLNVGIQYEDGSNAFDIRGGIHPLISDITSNLRLYQYQLAGWNEPSSIGQARPDVNPRRAIIRGDDDWRKKVRASLNLHFGIQPNRTRLPKFKTGSMASSNHLIRNPLILNQWRDIARTILAVEMEAAGVYEAAQGIRHQYPVMAIRGISDIIGLERDRQWTNYACQTAAAFTKAFVKAGIIDPPITVQLPTTQLLPSLSIPTDALPHRGIMALPPPTDPRTIQQREHVVKQVYTKLAQPGITAIVLTGIGGGGKSTLAALVYRYAEEQRLGLNGPFLAEALWLTVDRTVTFADLAGNLFEALGQPLPNLSNLAPQNQAMVLFNGLNTTERPRLVILDQFENLLNWETGHTLTDRPGVGEWLDIINSQQCACRILFTSRQRLVGTREYPATYLQEYSVQGLDTAEGVDLLRKQGVEAIETELHLALTRCHGHPLSLVLLASILRHNRSLGLKTLITNTIYTVLWTGNIASNLLNYIYKEQLDQMQRKLLLGFSVYREPIRLDAAETSIPVAIPRDKLLAALNVLLIQHLLQASGGERYQLHAIVASYAQGHFDERGEQANKKALQASHARSAQYYLQQAAMSCSSREQRRSSSDLHDLIEAIWQLCQAGQWQEAYDLMQQEYIFTDLKQWGGNAILSELYQLLLPLEKWHPGRSQAVLIESDLGQIYSALGQKEQARKYFEETWGIYRELGDRRGEGMSLNYLSRIYDDLGKKEQAQKYGEEALNALQEVGDRDGEAGALNNLGRTSWKAGQQERAQNYFEQALHMYRELGDRRGEGTTLNYLGWIHRDLGGHEQAQKYFEQALGILKEVGDREGEGKALNHLGRIYNFLGQYERSVKCCEEALTILREIGNRAWEATALNNLGLVYMTLGEREKAQEYFHQALSIRREMKDRWAEGRTLQDMGMVYLKQCYYHVALACFLLASGIFEEIHNPRSNETQREIEKIYQEVGDEKFSALLAKVEPQAQHIIEQALSEGLE